MEIILLNKTCENQKLLFATRSAIIPNPMENPHWLFVDLVLTPPSVWSLQGRCGQTASGTWTTLTPSAWWRAPPPPSPAASPTLSSTHGAAGWAEWYGWCGAQITWSATETRTPCTTATESGPAAGFSTWATAGATAPCRSPRRHQAMQTRTASASRPTRLGDCTPGSQESLSQLLVSVVSTSTVTGKCCLY